jgi:hypothetical protein
MYYERGVYNVAAGRLAVIINIQHAHIFRASGRRSLSRIMNKDESLSLYRPHK